MADNVRARIEAYSFAWDDKSFGLGVSIGIAPINGYTGGVTAAMSAADSACFAAKEQGRNRIHVYREDDAALAQVARGNSMGGENQQSAGRKPVSALFPAHHSPSIVPPRGPTTSFLIRMRDEDGSIVTPNKFLPAAERYNLATKLDRWVVKESFSWLQRNPDHLEQLYQCSINLSGHSLSDERFLDFVTEQFHELQVPPNKICFEVTETAAIENLPAATRFIKALKAIGCVFSLDDFGSGLSSFAYLKNLPVDILKIDGMFVRDIVNDPIELAMVRSINEIGHVMGKQTVAEFVEDQAIFDKLRETGVDYAQGYVVGRPRPIDEGL